MCEILREEKRNMSQKRTGKDMTAAAAENIRTDEMVFWAEGEGKPGNCCVGNFPPSFHTASEEHLT